MFDCSCDALDAAASAEKLAVASVRLQGGHKPSPDPSQGPGCGDATDKHDCEDKGG